jgi:hypothetical protein
MPCRTEIFFIGSFIICSVVFISSGDAQTVPTNALPQSPSLQNPFIQSPVTISPTQPSSAPTSGLPANVITPATTNRLSSGGATTGGAAFFGGAGRGLPGMPGGPPLNGTLGARDPNSQYMRPPAIGPLFCDPAINLPC